jgi:hypothetical protein
VLHLVTFSDDDEVLLEIELLPRRIDVGVTVKRFLDGFDW